jgi:DNA-binding SARP family transcriptional activator
MSRLVLSFLGSFQVVLDQRPITRFRSKYKGLLVYLAFTSERPISRELLATLFWPEEFERNARHNLRQALYRLRGLLQDHSNPDSLTCL